MRIQGHAYLFLYAQEEAFSAALKRIRQLQKPFSQHHPHHHPSRCAGPLTLMTINAQLVMFGISLELSKVGHVCGSAYVFRWWACPPQGRRCSDVRQLSSEPCIAAGFRQWRWWAAQRGACVHSTFWHAEICNFAASDQGAAMAALQEGLCTGH